MPTDWVYSLHGDIAIRRARDYSDIAVTKMGPEHAELYRLGLEILGAVSRGYVEEGKPVEEHLSKVGG